MPNAPAAPAEPNTPNTPNAPAPGGPAGDNPAPEPADASEPADLRAQVDDLRRQLADAREQADLAERRRSIDQALTAAGAVDLDTARLLTEMAVAQMDDADVSVAVADLRRAKPFLFQSDPAPASGPMAAHAASPAGAAAAQRDAAHAAATGDRVALLRYLRTRRAAR